MTPEFTSLVNPTLHYVLDLTSRIKGGGAQVDLKLERGQIRNVLRQAEEKAARLGGRAQADFKLARELLVYWTDELMTIADQNWREMTLEREYYTSQDRAWKFYMTGELDVRNGSGDVVELWYLALVLGFKGDIEDSFTRMNRTDFPPAGTSPDEARKLWAKELERLIPRKQSLGELTKPALTGDVIPLRGAAFLMLTLQWAGALFVLFCILVAWRVFAGE